MTRMPGRCSRSSSMPCASRKRIATVSSKLKSPPFLYTAPTETQEAGRKSSPALKLALDCVWSTLPSRLAIEPELRERGALRGLELACG